jgi:diketogulonate reductase-like aldo/keto reductase
MKIANGKTIEVPAVGYGTWATGQNSWAKDATLTALKEGYRHIDGAWAYGVDESIGAAIRESGVPREDIFFSKSSLPCDQMG